MWLFQVWNSAKYGTYLGQTTRADGCDVHLRIVTELPGKIRFQEILLFMLMKISIYENFIKAEIKIQLKQSGLLERKPQRGYIRNFNLLSVTQRMLNIKQNTKNLTKTITFFFLEFWIEIKHQTTSCKYLGKYTISGLTHPTKVYLE